MLKSLHLENFTVFPDARFEFGRHLNVVVGENGLGKTHALKAAYCVLAVSASGAKDSGSDSPTKAYLQTAIANKLRNVFKPDTIGRLARRQAGRNRCEVECSFDDKKFDLAFSFNTASKSEVTIDKMPSAWIGEVPVYLPTRELLTIYPGFVSIYETTHLPFPETWRDTAILLGVPTARGPREKKIRELLAPLEKAMDGSVELDESGRFSLYTRTGRFEMHLVAEGLRKLAMIARLIASGSLLDKGYLFWDEPDANLNPKLVRLVARTIVDIAQSGIQVFIATHSLFLLRELHILQQSIEKNERRPLFEGLDNRFFGLHLKAGGVEVTQGKTMDDIGNISALDEELAQSERYLEMESKLTTA
ncbi:MAG: AAA family ATPase [Chloroflexi bacterium]|nr:AAA family ATPase [Chloroflexota bacterium]